MNIRTLFLLSGLAAVFSQAAPRLDGTYWNFYSDLNWDVMRFERSGNRVSSEYIYDGGVIAATLSGDTLKGWWREWNNTMACGPGGSWSGAILFLFDSSGTKFTGDWDYCGDSADLDPHATNWIGTIRDSAFNEADCDKGHRYWCDGKCLLAPCDSEVTQENCEEAGRFWCDTACSLTQCGISAIRPVRQRRGIPGRMPMSRETMVDVSGRCLDARLRQAQGIYLGR